jgi:hypothetical protein
MAQTIVTRIGNAKVLLITNKHYGYPVYWIDTPDYVDLHPKLGRLSAAIGDAVLINCIRTIGAESC